MVSPEQVSSYIRKPYALDADAETQLREIIKEYPYFNNAWLLLARSLHNQNNSKFQKSLKQASLYGGNRALLYKLLNVDEEEAEEAKTEFANKLRTENATTPEQETVLAPVIETQAKEEQVESVSDEIADVTEQVEETVEEFTAEAHISSNEAKEEEVLENIEPIANTFEEEIETREVEFEKLENEAEEAVEEVKSSIENISNNEEEKVKSAYEEIFGSEGGNDEDNVNNEFETFDINETVTADEPILPSFDDDDDFVLQIDDNSSTANIMADAIVDEGVYDTKTEDKTLQEEVITPESSLETEEEDFALNIDEPIEEGNASELSSISENIEEVVSANLENSEDKVEAIESAQELQNDNVQEEENTTPITSETILERAEPNITETVNNEADNYQEEINEVEEAIDVGEETIAVSAENTDSISEAIAFKLNNGEQVIEEKQVERITEVADKENNLLAPSTFFEWLTQLKNPKITDNGEKKNEIAEEAISTAVSQSQQAPIYVEEHSTENVPEKKSNVDDIIERFIKINPTISRPKAEFYNPEVKSRESDTESDDLATETLAKIYRDQKLNYKAIDIYKRLCALYPNKATEYNAIIAEIENE